MRAAILAVGSELLGPDRVDTNSLELAAVLTRFGIPVAAKSVIGDDVGAIAGAASFLMRENELLLVTGGLGPTQDDLTREAISQVLNRPLVRDQEVLERLRRRFARFGVTMVPVNEKQADVIAGAEVLDNRRGTAPGLEIVHDTGTIFLFPGVAHELRGLVDRFLVPWLERNSSDEGLETSVLKVACIPESTLEQKLQPFYERWGEAGVALLPSPGEVAIRLTAAGTARQREEWLSPRRRALRDLLQRMVFSVSAEGSLEQSAGEALSAAGLSIATAESCTGGLIAERLTRVAGSSDYFLGAVVSYANSVKTELLSVPGELVRTHGAVSEEVSRAMAFGARAAVGADIALAVTGIAGPGGGSEEKPVGTVHVAICGPEGSETEHRRLQLPGDRERVRWVTSQWALEMIRRRALEIRGSRATRGPQGAGVRGS